MTSPTLIRFGTVSVSYAKTRVWTVEIKNKPKKGKEEEEKKKAGHQHFAKRDVTAVQYFVIMVKAPGVCVDSKRFVYFPFRTLLVFVELLRTPSCALYIQLEWHGNSSIFDGQWLIATLGHYRHIARITSMSIRFVVLPFWYGFPRWIHIYHAFSWNFNKTRWNKQKLFRRFPRR